jgi:hypothetical protein
LKGIDLSFQQQPMLIGAGVEEIGRGLLIERLGLYPTAWRCKICGGHFGRISLNRHRQNTRATDSSKPVSDDPCQTRMKN